MSSGTNKERFSQNNNAISQHNDMIESLLNTVNNLVSATEVTAEPGDVRKTKKYINSSGQLVEGTMEETGTEDLEAELVTQDNELKDQEDVLSEITKNLASRISSGAASLNVFIQEDEPITKDGIWVRTDTDRDITFVQSMDISLSPLEDTSIILPISFTKGQAAIINNDLWIVKGASVYSYNFDTKAWTTHAALPYSANEGLGNTLQHDGEYLYIPNIATQYTIHIMRYNIANDTCETKTFSTGSNADPAGLCLTENGYLWWIGWQTTSTISVSNIQYRYGMAQLNFETGAITTKTHVPTTHCYGANIVAVGNNIYLIGSANAMSNSPTSVAKFIYVYDTINDVYEHIYTSDINIHISSSVLYKNYIICMLQSNKKILIINTDDNSVYWFDMEISGDFTYAQLAVSDAELFIIGGTDNATGVKTAKINIEDVLSNGVHIINPTNKAKLYVKLVPNSNMFTGINDVICTDIDSNVDNVNTYYGNGTEWVQI